MEYDITLNQLTKGDLVYFYDYSYSYPSTYVFITYKEKIDSDSEYGYVYVTLINILTGKICLNPFFYSPKFGRIARGI